MIQGSNSSFNLIKVSNKFAIILASTLTLIWIVYFIRALIPLDLIRIERQNNSKRFNHKPNMSIMLICVDYDLGILTPQYMA